jgi:large subunit ribosomal protein L22
MTEKNYNPEQKGNKSMKKQQKAEQKKEIVDAKKIEDKKEKTEKEEVKEEKKPIQKKEKVKKDEAIVRGVSLPISTKSSVEICRFIRKKTIDKAISDLEEVLKFKKAIPMRGEIPHRKGKGMMSGRYLTKAVGHFLKLLKTLKANANVNGLEEPVIIEAIPNKASRPYGRFGSIKRKRTHIKIKVIEKNKLKEKKK